MSALPAPAGGQSSLEADLLARVNGGRSPDLLRHSGLTSVALSRAQSMAAKSTLHHSGAESAIANASPDPAESNGAPDDGYTQTWCENIAVTSNSGNIGSMIYSGWRNSPSHNSCMNDTRMNAAGIGAVLDQDPCPGATSAGCWWVVMDLTRDNTPPGSSPAVRPSIPRPSTLEPAATRAQDENPSVRTDTNGPAADDDARATSTPEPEVSPTSSPTPSPEDEEQIERGDVEVRTEAADNDRPSTRATFGARVYAAISVLLLIALLVLFLARRRI